MQRITAVVFDCDGVMFDTRASNAAYYNTILAHFDGPVLTDDQFAFVHMHTVDESLAHLFADAKTLAQAQAYRRQVSYLPFLDRMEMEPDLTALLAWLRPTYRTAIATNRTDTMNRVLAVHGLTDVFDLVVCASDVPRPKPFPDCLQRVCDVFSLGPEQAIYIGDSKLDEMAAHAAGMPFVAYADPSLDADFHIDHLCQVREILEEAEG
ncbi:MAG: HAD-IA family hydrolase [Desulfobacterales bacterium]|nr:HAD-IA family hydrolase [Desulfobacterales bacterium]